MGRRQGQARGARRLLFKRSYAPIWISDGKANDRARAAIEYLAHVDADGLNPADYVVPDVASITDPASIAEAEIKLSAAVTSYVRHAQVGRVHWSRVSGDIFYTLQASPAADVLANLAGSGDVAAALAAYEPQTAGYLALKAKLAELRAGSSSALPGKIPAGTGAEGRRAGSARAARSSASRRDRRS